MQIITRSQCTCYGVELYVVEIHSKYKDTALAWPNILSALVSAFSTKSIKSKSDLLTRFKKKN